MANRKRGHTLLEDAINGREVLAYVNGKYSLYPNSKLYKAIKQIGFSIEDIGKSIDIAIGARREHYTEGYKMAIVLNEWRRHL